MSDDSVSIVLSRPQAQSLYNILDRVQVQGLKAKTEIIAIMVALEAALKDK